MSRRKNEHLTDRQEKIVGSSARTSRTSGSIRRRPIHYTVWPGDRLSTIAPRFKESWQQLYADNRKVVGSDPDVICPGMVLSVRHAGTGSAVSHMSVAALNARTVPLS
ncbi:LysM domain-containing protein [Streptomyces sp. NPDC052107]|uniref:LysM peptidoglycan-binding domain-containing protein n=1 Tax=Streptomyces sp. NPDC052107 TaxID=3155632 RepID=UPI003440E53C